MFDNWDDALDPSPVDLATMGELDTNGWDDIDGIDFDGHGSDDDVVTGVAWIHSLLYSDYQDAGDDDDRADNDIPQSALSALYDDEVA